MADLISANESGRHGGGERIEDSGRHGDTRRSSGGFRAPTRDYPDDTGRAARRRGGDDDRYGETDGGRQGGRRSRSNTDSGRHGASDSSRRAAGRHDAGAQGSGSFRVDNYGSGRYDAAPADGADRYGAGRSAAESGSGRFRVDSASSRSEVGRDSGRHGSSDTATGRRRADRRAAERDGRGATERDGRDPTDSGRHLSASSDEGGKRRADRRATPSGPTETSGSYGTGGSRRADRSAADRSAADRLSEQYGIGSSGRFGAAADRSADTAGRRGESSGGYDGYRSGSESGSAGSAERSGRYPAGPAGRSGGYRLDAGGGYSRADSRPSPSPRAGSESAGESARSGRFATGSSEGTGARRGTEQSLAQASGAYSRTESAPYTRIGAQSTGEHSRPDTGRTHRTGGFPRQEAQATRDYPVPPAPSEGTGRYAGIGADSTRSYPAPQASGPNPAYDGPQGAGQQVNGTQVMNGVGQGTGPNPVNGSYGYNGAPAPGMNGSQQVTGTQAMNGGPGTGAQRTGAYAAYNPGPNGSSEVAGTQAMNGMGNGTGPQSTGAYGMNGTGPNPTNGWQGTGPQRTGAYAVNGTDPNRVNGAGQSTGAYAVNGTGPNRVTGVGQSTGAYAVNGTDSNRVNGAGQSTGAYAVNGSGPTPVNGTAYIPAQNGASQVAATQVMNGAAQSTGTYAVNAAAHGTGPQRITGAPHTTGPNPVYSRAEGTGRYTIPAESPSHPQPEQQGQSGGYPVDPARTTVEEPQAPAALVRAVEAVPRQRPAEQSQQSARYAGGYAGGMCVQAIDLVKDYGSGPGAVRALAGITVGAERHRFTAIMGPSGSGKSTLLHCMAGLDAPTSGRVLLGDTDLTQLPEKKLTKLRRDRIGFVFQSYALLPQLSVLQNMTLPLEVANRKVDEQWLRTVVDALDLGSVLKSRPTRLSGGQQQRVAMARALLPRPEVVFADEPTGALDATTAREMLQFLRASVRELGQTVVMVTHDPLAAEHTDHVLLLHQGALAAQIANPTAPVVLDALTVLDRMPTGGWRPYPNGNPAALTAAYQARQPAGRLALPAGRSA